MSWLLLDAGNSALKWRLVSPAAWPVGEDAAEGWRGTHASADAPDDAPVDPALRAALAQAVQAACAAGRAVRAVLGCSVASDARRQRIEAAVLQALAQQPEVAPPLRWLEAAESFAHGAVTLRNGYRAPRQLGADRWHALIGACLCFPGEALLVVNAGTATTLDHVDAQGQFQGGVIAPGLALMRASLARGTARLPLAAGGYVAQPDNTDDAIATGVLEAQLGLIQRRLRAVANRATDTAVRLVLSGGHAPALLPFLQAQAGLGKMAHEPDLVLRGLWLRARAEGAAGAAASGSRASP